MKKIIKMWNRQALPIILITGYLREEKMKNAKKKNKNNNWFYFIKMY